MKQKFFTLFLALIASVGIASAQSGSCGDNLTWTLADSVLTISGTGAMEHYTRDAPWYDYRLSIKSIVINDGVTNIGEFAFYNCSSLSSITIPNSVTSIGDDAFASCYSLTSVTILNSVTSIGEGAFWACYSLTSVTIPNSVTSIGYVAFSNCSSLTSINVDAYNSKYSSADGVLFNKDKTTLITYPGGKQGAYTIPNSVTSIVDEAFYDCRSLTSITCEAATPPTIGGTYTFARVSKSIPVYVPCGCVEAYKAASGWSDFTNIQEPLAEYSIEVYVNDAIIGTAKVNYNTFCEGAQISATPNLGYHFVQWSDGNAENPRTLALTQDTILIAEFAQSFSGQCGDNLYWEFIDGNLHITGDGAMYNYRERKAPWTLLLSSIKSLSISEGTTTIGNYAFAGCSSLTSITIPNSVTTIGSRTFSNCSSLTSVVINSDAIVNKAYTSSSNLSNIFGSQVTEYIIGDNVKGIGSSVFAGCSSLTSVTIGNGVTSIGNYAFYGCKSLTSVTIPNSVTSIGSSVFYGCSSLSSVTIPNSVTSIGNDAFWRCSSLTSVTIGNGVTSIGDYAFQYCSSLTSVTIPNSVTSIGSSAFEGCSSLTSVHITDLAAWCNVDFEGYSANPLYYAHKLYLNGELVKDLVIPNSVISIGSSVFYGCSSLSSITIPNSVTSIGDYAFEGCSALYSIIWNAKNCADASSSKAAPFYGITSQIKSFAFGEMVEHVPAYLCKGMEKLTSVTFPNSVKTIGTSAFEGCIRLGKVSLGKNLETIGANAFAECTRLYDIYTYATYPPFAEVSSFANYNVYVYIPCEYKRDYTLDVVWGKFKFIECISSDNVTTDEIVVTPSENEANVIWPSVNGAATYELVIKDKDGNIVCALIFNANGQLTSIAFNAPSRNGVPAQTQNAGFSFTITGLDSGTGYDLTLTAKDNSGNAIQTETISFVTTGGNVSTDIDQLQGHKVQSTKVVKDGQIYILRNGKTYTMQGQEVK